MPLDQISGYAHRGLHNPLFSVVENSATAIRMAVDAGVGIEIDVQMSSDRIPMVFHDETLFRLTGEDGRLSFMKAKELEKVSYSVGTDHIIPLEDCLSLVDGKVPLLIEVKSHWTELPEMEQGLIDVLKSYDGSHGLMSFDPSIIERLKNLGSPSPLGLVTAQCPSKDWPGITEEQRQSGTLQFEKARELVIDFIAHEIGDIHNPYLSKLIQDLKIPMMSWTVKSSAMLQSANEMNAIPIFETGDDDRLRALLRHER
jgi:glycerophosphoryl diester phosphodiesterase